MLGRRQRKPSFLTFALSLPRGPIFFLFCLVTALSWCLQLHAIVRLGCDILLISPNLLSA
jgi:hypothetical protein